MVLIRRPGIEDESFVANRHSPAALESVTIVIENFFPRAFVNHRLVALEARSLFALAGRHSDGAEFDSFDRPIRLRFPAVETDAVEARIFEGLQEQVFSERP